MRWKAAPLTRCGQRGLGMKAALSVSAPGTLGRTGTGRRKGGPCKRRTDAGRKHHRRAHHGRTPVRRTGGRRGIGGDIIRWHHSDAQRGYLRRNAAGHDTVIPDADKRAGLVKTRVWRIDKDPLPCVQIENKQTVPLDFDHDGLHNHAWYLLSVYDRICRLKTEWNAGCLAEGRKEPGPSACKFKMRAL